MAKGLKHKPEDLSFEFYNLCENMGATVNACNLASKEV